MDALAALATARTCHSAWTALREAHPEVAQADHVAAFRAATVAILLWDELRLYADAHLCLLRIQRAEEDASTARRAAMAGLARAARAEGMGSPATVANDVLSMRAMAVGKLSESTARIAAQELRARDEVDRRRADLVRRADGIAHLTGPIRDREIMARLYAVGDLDGARRLSVLLERRGTTPASVLDGADELAHLRAREARLLALSDTAESVPDALAAERALQDARADAQALRLAGDALRTDEEDRADLERLRRDQG